ncbi:MAG: hypothetical protein ABUK01_03255 [Leptospirales bacterium]
MLKLYKYCITPIGNIVFFTNEVSAFYSTCKCPAIYSFLRASVRSYAQPTRRDEITLLDAMTKRTDRLMIWMFSLAVTSAGVVIAILR